MVSTRWVERLDLPRGERGAVLLGLPRGLPASLGELLLLHTAGRGWGLSVVRCSSRRFGCRRRRCPITAEWGSKEAPIPRSPGKAEALAPQNPRNRKRQQPCTKGVPPSSVPLTVTLSCCWHSLAQSWAWGSHRRGPQPPSRCSSLVRETERDQPARGQEHVTLLLPLLLGLKGLSLTPLGPSPVDSCFPQRGQWAEPRGTQIWDLTTGPHCFSSTTDAGGSLATDAWWG